MICGLALGPFGCDVCDEPSAFVPLTKVGSGRTQQPWQAKPVGNRSAGQWPTCT